MTGRPQPAHDIRAMSDPEAAWLGGFIDGEGRFDRYRLQVTSTELEYMSACLRVTGVGTLGLQRAPGQGLAKQNNWVWTVHGIRTIAALAARIAPWCMKANEVIS